MKYDIFISYRREGGYDTAKHLNDLLVRDGYKVSFDLDTLRNGDFDTQLLTRIEECTDFLLIVDEHAFDRTLDPTFDPQKDWLRCELAHALKHNKNIIPIFLSGKSSFPEGLPKDIVGVVKKNSPEYNRSYFDSFYKQLRKRFLKSRSVKPKITVGLLFLTLIAVISLPFIKQYTQRDSNYIHNQLEEVAEQKAAPVRTTQPSTKSTTSSNKGTTQTQAKTQTKTKTQTQAQPKQMTAAERQAEEARKAEAERKAKEKAEAERIAKEKAEAERLAAEEARKIEEARKAEQRKIEEARIAEERAAGKGVNGVYAVGDYYNRDGKEGVVIDVSYDGKHGKIVSLNQGKQLKWCSDKQSKIRLNIRHPGVKFDTGTADEWNGKANTDNIMASRDAKEFPPFVWCRNLGSDWYLPAIEEFKALIIDDETLNAVNKTLADRGAPIIIKKNNNIKVVYWTSTEFSIYGSWTIQTSPNVYITSTNTNVLSSVRAFAAF